MSNETENPTTDTTKKSKKKGVWLKAVGGIIMVIAFAIVGLCMPSDIETAANKLIIPDLNQEWKGKGVTFEPFENFKKVETNEGELFGKTVTCHTCSADLVIKRDRDGAKQTVSKVKVAVIEDDDMYRAMLLDAAEDGFEQELAQKVQRFVKGL